MAMEVQITGNVGAAVNAINQVENKLKSFAKTSSSATVASINLGRVIQDLPYGFIGIANNLNPLLESFQRLRKESGSTGGALKAFLGSLTGAGGIGLALSAVTSIITISTFGIMNFGRKSKEAASDTDELSKAAEEAKKKQEEFASAINQASSAIISQKKHFEDIRSIIDETSSSYNNLTKATINQAVLTYLLEQKESELKKILAAQVEREILLRQTSGMQGMAGVPEFTFDPVINNLERHLKALQNLGQPIGELQKLINRLKELNQIIGQGGAKIDLANALSKWLGELKVFDTPALKIKPDKVTIRPALGSIDLELPTIFDEKVKSRLQQQIDKLSEKIQFRPTLDISSKPTAAGNNRDAIEKMIEHLKELQKVAEFVGNKIADIFDSVFDAFVRGENAIKALGEAIKQVVVDAIKAFARMLIINAIGKLFGVPIPIGLPGRASGGPVSAGRPYVVGEVGKELFIPSTSGRIVPNSRLNSLSGAASPTIIFNGRLAISGQELKLLLNRSERYQNSNV